MALLIENRLLFIHQPKTGGCWVHDVLKSLGFSTQYVGTTHCMPLTSPQIYQVLKRHDVECFTAIRHPITWYPSCWAFVRSLGNIVKYPRADHYNPFWRILPLMGTDFNVFIQSMLDLTPGYLTNLVLDYITLPPQGCPMKVSDYREISYVLKMESLREDLWSILSRFGLSTSPVTKDVESFIKERPGENVCPNEFKKQAKYTLDTCKGILETEHGIITKFGYDSSVEFCQQSGLIG